MGRLKSRMLPMMRYPASRAIDTHVGLLFKNQNLLEDGGEQVEQQNVAYDEVPSHQSNTCPLGPLVTNRTYLKMAMSRLKSRMFPMRYPAGRAIHTHLGFLYIRTYLKMAMSRLNSRMFPMMRYPARRVIHAQLGLLLHIELTWWWIWAGWTTGCCIRWDTQQQSNTNTFGPLVYKSEVTWRWLWAGWRAGYCLWWGIRQAEQYTPMWVSFSPFELCSNWKLTWKWLLAGWRAECCLSQQSNTYPLGPLVANRTYLKMAMSRLNRRMLPMMRYPASRKGTIQWKVRQSYPIRFMAVLLHSKERLH